MPAKSKTTRPAKTQDEVTTPVEVVEPTVGKVVNCTAVRIRKEMSTDSDVLTIVNNGVNLIVEKTKNKEWLKVKIDDKLTGFVMSDYIEL